MHSLLDIFALFVVLFSILLYEEIAYVRYIKILTWLRGFRVKIANFEHKENQTKHIEYQKWPESLGVTLEFQ